MKRPILLSILLMFLPGMAMSDEKDPLRLEKEKQLEAEKLAASDAPSHRLLAGQLLLGLDSPRTPGKIVDKLLIDANPDVRGMAYAVIAEASHNQCFTLDEAKKFSESLAEDVSTAKIDLLF